MKHELLAPAGNIEAGYAALYYGADAVYLGLTKFSARAGAENFTAEELDSFTSYAHSLNRKVYVALNTILNEEEINELPQTVAVLKQAQVDAVIVQDLGVIHLLKKMAPEIELHASTQMAVHNMEGAKFLQSVGFKRVVLARELTLDEIKKIAHALPDLDLEVFIHGALCYCYSGQCLFSALEYGKSANRGRCVYPCRAFYSADEDGLKGHLFSMKDLALAEKVNVIPALSLKIEGRKKSPLYVAAVTNYYRHILNGDKNVQSLGEDIKQIFSRPWCQFHFNGKSRDVTDEQFVGHRGLLIGKIEKIFKNRLVFKTTRDIARYDGLQIDSGTDEKPYGFGIKALYVAKKSVFEVKAGQTAEVELPDDHPHLVLGAPIYLASSSAVKGRYDYAKPKANAFHHVVDFELKVELSCDTIWAMSGQQAVCVKGQFTQAKDVHKTIDAVYQAFGKTGDSRVRFQQIDVVNPQQLFAPLSLLNELRRQMVSALENELNNNSFMPSLPELKPFGLTDDKNRRQINVLAIDVHSLVHNFSDDEIQNGWFLLPQICRQTALLKPVLNQLYEAGARHFMIDNYYGFELLKSYPDIKIATGSFIYVMNRYAAAELKTYGAFFCVPALEASDINKEQLVRTSPLALAEIVSCRPPLFTSAVCIRRNDCAHCSHQEKQWVLKTGGREYIAVSKDCQLQLFNKEKYVRSATAGMWATITL